MKKIIGMMVFCLVILGVVPKGQPEAVTPILTPTPTPIEYVLPFPGILPTHPLYFFKSFRDRIIEFLITDPINKAEFYVLQADKKLNMGITLRADEKPVEAKESYEDALVSRNQAITLLEGHVQSGDVVPGHLREKLLLSLAKHKEVLVGMGSGIADIEAMTARVQLLSRAMSE